MKRYAIILSFVFLGMLGAATISRAAYAASLSIAPASGSYSSQNSFTATVYLSTDKSANAVSGVLSFPADLLQVVSVSKDRSIVNFWVQEPSFSNRDGTVQFEGVVLNPGFTGSAGRVLSIVFRTRAVGAATVEFTSGSVLANDGKGTNILTALSKARYQVTAAANTDEALPAPTVSQPSAILVVRSDTHPEPDKWYRSKTASFFWNTASGVEAMAYELDKSSNTTPKTQASVTDRASYDLEKYGEGSWYFHLRVRTAKGWSPVVHRRIRADFTPPAVPSLSRVDAGDPTNPRPEFAFSSEDELSGAASYQAKIGNGEWFGVDEVAKKFVVPLQAPGKHQLSLQVIDRAGNRSIGEHSFEVAPLPAPVILQARYLKKGLPDNLVAEDTLFLEGQASAASKVFVQVAKGNKTKSEAPTLTFSVQADERGYWSAKHPFGVGTGTWIVKAYISDERGALSNESVPVLFNTVTSSSKFLYAFLDWGVTGFAGVLIVAAILAMILYLLHSFKKLRLRLRTDLLDFKKELHKDIVALEAELAEPTRGTKLNLRALQKNEAVVKKGLKRLEKDVQEGIDRLAED